MSTTSVRNFSLLNAQSVTVTASDTTATVQLNSNTAIDIMLINNTTSTIFVRTGNSNVVADANAMPILPGEKGVYTKGNSGGSTSHLAYFVAAGTADLTILQGDGS